MKKLLGLFTLGVALVLSLPLYAQQQYVVVQNCGLLALTPGSRGIPYMDVTGKVCMTGYLYTPVANGQYALAPTSSTALTVPNGATYAVVCAETATVRYTTSGTTPTGTVGMPLTAGTCVGLSGSPILSAFRAFSSTGTLDVEYYK